MAIDKAYLRKLSTPREKRSMMLSYRRYHLLGRIHGGIGKVIFDKYKDQYTPRVWAFALSLYFHQRVVEHFKPSHFKQAQEIYEDWESIWREQPYVHIELTDDQVQSQLEFMGYEKDLKTHDLYAYVSSNRQINGHWYIHPKKYVDHIDSIGKRPSYPYIYDTWDDYALEGYTKILRHGTEP